MYIFRLYNAVFITSTSVDVKETILENHLNLYYFFYRHMT